MHITQALGFLLTARFMSDGVVVKRLRIKLVILSVAKAKAVA